MPYRPALTILETTGRESKVGLEKERGKKDMASSIFAVKMLPMYTRRLSLPERSFFLFGPRATGKSTWLRQVLPQATWIDLLRTQTMLELAREPDLFRQRALALPHGSWVVIDEVQRLPTLLHEVHALLSEAPGTLRFAMSGSSARKLKRSEGNLLAGRASTRAFFPLTASELGGTLDLDRILRFGLLPQVHTEPASAIDILEAYSTTYLREEIMQEAFVRNIESFARFLGVAALQSAQIINVAGLSRDAAVSRPTVQGYFDVLVDTLIGFWLPAWKKRVRVKETTRPKFYFFDPGVVRTLAGRVREPLGDAERGFLLETWVLHELRAAVAYQEVGGELSYWRTPSGSEVDFLWTRGERCVGIEVKSSPRWRKEYGAVLNAMIDEQVIKHGFGVYCGEHELRDGAVRVLPVAKFLEVLAAGELFA